MTKISTLLVAAIVAAISINAFAQVNNYRMCSQMQIDEIETSDQTIESHRLESAQFKVNQSPNANGLVLASDFKYNSNNQLVERSTYKFDKVGRQIEKITYIINDYSKSWMGDKDQWIVYSITKLGYDPTDSRQVGARQISNESYYLDTNTGILRGSSRWTRTYSEYTNIISAYESYSWNTTTNEWKGSFKYECTYNLNGNILSEEEIPFDWNSTDKTWTKSTNKKNIYKYIKNAASWLQFEYKEYTFTNGRFEVSFEQTLDINISANSFNSYITKTLEGNQLVNAIKLVNIFNTNNRIKQTENYNWINNQWVLTIKDTYEYTTPDSIRTQTTYYTAAYYTYNILALPTLCENQSLYPVRKTIFKKHPISNNLEISYSYNWTNCGWAPTGTKYIYTFDNSGTKSLTLFRCTTNNGTDWTGCRNYSYEYNSKGMLTVYTSKPDGNASSYKSELIYLADTIKATEIYYKTVDLNNDNLIADTEWVFDGQRTYKYNLASEGDSLHLNVEQNASLKIFDLSSIKKLKVTGPINCEDLSYITKLSWDSLEMADLSDATFAGDSLKSDCFDDEIRLLKLILPKTLKTIVNGAIRSGDDEDEDSKSLKELTIYPSIEKIENGAFYIMNLEKVTMPSAFFDKLYTFTAIPGINDVYKSTLKSITFNDQSGKIQDAVCYNLPQLQHVTILDGVTEIGNNAFKSCGMLREVNFPATLQKIGYNAFWGCNELTSLTLPEGLKTIDYSAFWGCSGVTAINMPSSLISISQNAFWGCSAVSSMNVAAQTPPMLGNNALQGVPRDANITVPEIGFSAYKAAPQWKEFFNMKTDVAKNELKNIVLSSANGLLMLQNLPQNITVNIYSTTGAKLMQITPNSNSETIELAKGAYLLQIGNQRFKTIVN